MTIQFHTDDSNTGVGVVARVEFINKPTMSIASSLSASPRSSLSSRASLSSSDSPRDSLSSLASRSPSDSPRDSLSSLASRSHYFDVSLHSNLERFIRIKQVCQNTDILRGRKFTEKEIDEILEFIEVNLGKFTELSLRTISKTADMFSHDQNNWKTLL
jgi:hypothetical protein